MTARLFAAVVAVALLAPAGRADDDNPLGPEHGGEMTLFRSLLRYAGVKPIASLSEFHEKYANKLDDVIVVMIGPPPQNDESWKPGALMNIVYPAGGAFFLAANEPLVAGHHFSADTRLCVSTRKVIARTPTACLARVPTRPYLLTARDPDERDPYLNRIADLKRIAADAPAAFDFSTDGGNRVSSLAYYSELSEHDRRAEGSPAGTSAGLVFRAKAGGHAGVGVVVPSPGMFTNRMLTARDADNFAFTYYLAKFLVTSRPDGRWRTRCLFIENGQVRTDFDAIPLLTPQVPPLSPPVPSLDEIQDKIVDAANAALAEAQDRDAFGGPVADNFDRIMKVAGPILAAIALVVLLTKVWAARYGGRAAPSPKPAAELAPFDLRRQAVLKGNDLGGPVREYLRGLFARWGAAEGAEMPKVVFDRPREDRKVMTQLRTLWDVAFGAEATVSAGRWAEELEPMIAFVSRAAAAGRWKFARPGGAA